MFHIKKPAEFLFRPTFNFRQNILILFRDLVTLSHFPDSRPDVSTKFYACSIFVTLAFYVLIKEIYIYSSHNFIVFQYPLHFPNPYSFLFLSCYTVTHLPLKGQSNSKLGRSQSILENIIPFLVF
jgi:hypothetical protein